MKYLHKILDLIAALGGVAASLSAVGVVSPKIGGAAGAVAVGAAKLATSPNWMPSKPPSPPPSE